MASSSHHEFEDTRNYRGPQRPRGRGPSTDRHLHFGSNDVDHEAYLRSYKSPLNNDRIKKTTPEQTKVLEAEYSRTPYPTRDTRLSLALQLNMKPRSVQIWFQNKRRIRK
ncbi:hypothetical protein PLICRDRAFT_58436 [Plicaturopsis crispa FD-325 SS-3]|uniref:Homeobox domain-containing protein n=1 Tax=Plicaturopsis crispa FD-325 SS-3 TaxID=944288 RepID=A0A0C9SQ57_PLICR|nr:hypothetical protein PLICRDRAFT_58436 [Plicaturopsis crispa FD-325 SS-3]